MDALGQVKTKAAAYKAAQEATSAARGDLHESIVAALLTGEVTAKAVAEAAGFSYEAVRLITKAAGLRSRYVKDAVEAAAEVTKRKVKSSLT